MSDLIQLNEITPAELFTDEGLKSVLEKIEKAATSEVPDLSTKKGRDAIASLARKVASSKTHIDGIGKELVSGWKSQSKIVDTKRKHAREFLDELKAEVRKPLTEYEEAEKARTDKLEADIVEIVDAGFRIESQWQTIDVEHMGKESHRIDGLYAFDWQEFKVIAHESIGKAIQRITDAIAKRTKHDEEQAELAELRALKAKQEQKERDERIAEEAVAKEKNEAAEREKRAEMKAKQAMQDKLLAEERAKEEIQKAEQRAKDAVEAEKSRVEAEKAQERADQERRERNTRLKGEVNKKILAELVKLGSSEKLGKKIIASIVKGEISNTTITY